MSLNTAFILLAQYQTAVIPASKVARDYFELSTDKFRRKCLSGEIRLPLVRMVTSQKSATGVHINDLAEFLDRRRTAALKVAGMARGDAF